jgi:hypothetical protein
MLKFKRLLALFIIMAIVLVAIPLPSLTVKATSAVQQGVVLRDPTALQWHDDSQALISTDHTFTNESKAQWKSIFASNSDGTPYMFATETLIEFNYKISGFDAVNGSCLSVSFRNDQPQNDLWNSSENYLLSFEGDKVALKKNGVYITTNPNTTMCWYDSSFHPTDGLYHTAASCKKR